MGCTESKPRRHTEYEIQIENELKEEAMLDREKVKLLILGAGESGKSTVFKQMKLIYGVKFSEAECRNAISTIHCNITQFMQSLCSAVIKFRLENEIEAHDYFRVILETGNHEVCLDKLLCESIMNLWKDPGIQKAWKRRTEFQIIDSIEYYYNKLEEIFSSEYIPDQDDMLHLRVRTTGIVTEKYDIDGTAFEIYDVGGQRNERKKWIHCFEGVTAVIFVAAISEYGQKLFEDDSTNRMVEALNLFQEICNNRYFLKSSMILFLNKIDLFAEKVLKNNIRDIPAFSDYKGKDKDTKDGADYFKKKFLDLNSQPESRTIYTHLTCATDTKNVKVVFDACKDIILRENMDGGWEC